ncbi:hypothetical protein [Paraburkholderia sediminicola]|uniref:hypothetical protein n=1 Tax=Paraburkholderia sediminicola TaxID=458836 RepID=UPI0038BBA3FD
MPLQASVSVEVGLGAALLRWKIVDVDAGTRHSARSDSLAFIGNVSSAVVEFDTAEMDQVSRSGGIYKLLGNAGDSKHANHVLDSWWVVRGTSVRGRDSRRSQSTPLRLILLNASTSSR